MPTGAVARRRSNTKFRPWKSEVLAASTLSFAIASQYVWIPPRSWKHSVTPFDRKYADARSQRIPPVQYMSTFGGGLLGSLFRPLLLLRSPLTPPATRPRSAMSASAHAGNSSKRRVEHRVAPSKWPISLSKWFRTSMSTSPSYDVVVEDEPPRVSPSVSFIVSPR